MSVRDFSSAEIELLREVIQERRRVRLLAGDRDDKRVHQCTDCYVAKVPEAGIPMVDCTGTGIGTGTASGFAPGSATCNIYKYDFEEALLVDAGFTLTVYNVSGYDITESDCFVPITKTKYGIWVAGSSVIGKTNNSYHGSIYASTFAVPSGSGFVLITLNLALESDGSGVLVDTANNRLTVTTPGKYQIALTGEGYRDDLSQGNGQVRIYKNGALLGAEAVRGYSQQICDPGTFPIVTEDTLAANDYIQAYALKTSTTAQTLTNVILVVSSR